ncbi:MAG: hypothetical protein WA970_16365 [Gammaproteobacteria bacterium]
MTGKLEWLNESAYRSGRWTAAIPYVIEQSDEVSFTATEGRDICIHEIDRSGSVLLSSVEPDPRPLMGYGDAEVFLTIFFATGLQEDLSGPLHTPIRVDGVSTLRLNLRILIGHEALDSIDYHVVVSAHCIFERLSEHGF